MVVEEGVIVGVGVLVEVKVNVGVAVAVAGGPTQISKLIPVYPETPPPRAIEKLLINKTSNVLSPPTKVPGGTVTILQGSCWQ
jgi:hypothetical protein